MKFAWYVIKEKCLNVVYGIRNLIKWLPIIWKDRDWDWTFLMIILSFKLKNMSELHEKYSVYKDYKKRSHDLKTASILADRIADEEYYYDVLNNKDKHSNVNAFKAKEKLHNRDIKTLFRLMEKELKNWWD